MFCSELIAQLYAEQGMFDSRKTPPESVLPGTFWTSSVAWMQGQGLQDAEQIIGDESLIPAFKQEHERNDKTIWAEGARTSAFEARALRLVEDLWT